MRRAPVLVGVLCGLLVFAWQFLTVQYNYHGDWSALFCTGSQAALSAPVAAEHPYRFAASAGWDGQWYHAIAHDPLLRRGTADAMDDSRDSARLRYRRILIPTAAWLLAAGNDAWVDWAYRIVMLGAFALGGGWLAALAQAGGRSPLFGFAFVLVPASVAAIDREAIDVWLLAFCCAFALYTRFLRRPRLLYVLLVVAALARDTGLLLTAAYCLWLLWERRFRACAAFATAAVPALAWYGFVASRTVAVGSLGSVAFPFSGVVNRLTHPFPYVDSVAMTAVLRIADLLAVMGVLLAMLISFHFFRRRRGPDPVAIAILLFAGVGIFLWRPNDWLEALDYARILSPLLLLEAVAGWPGSPLPGLLPLCLVLPRFGLEMASQAAGVIKGLL